MTFLEQLQRRLQERIDARHQAHSTLTALLDGVAARGDDADLTTEEQASFQEIRSRIAALDVSDPEAEGYGDSIAGIQARISELEGIEARQVEVSQNSPRVVPGEEERTYRRDRRTSFFADLYSHQVSRTDPEASERILRHQREMEVEIRDRARREGRADPLLVGNVTGVIPPTHLRDRFINQGRGARAFLNTLTPLELPEDGTSFTIPSVTQAASAGWTAEAAPWVSADIELGQQTSTVDLVTSKQDISRTLFMRGGTIVDDILFPEMITAVEFESNTGVLTGDGLGDDPVGILNVAGVNQVTYTDATPTVGELWPKLSDALQRVNSARFLPVSVVAMHPRRWAWITSATDANGRPLFEFSTNVPANSVFGTGSAAEYGQIVGQLQGVPVVTDASIPTNLGAGTNEDVIIAYRSSDLLYWEDDLMQFTFEQTVGPHQVRLAVGRFAMFNGGRYPQGISTITGTGLITPAF